MAPRLPNVFIYLSALIRPARLRPDLRVRTIADVDYAGLRREGFNAVVVDKDNCVTLPEQDECYPPFKQAWADLLSAFEPGRVLVVSNSAGTRKDPLGIAAESVSHHLKTPVLVHAQPKPGCAPEIIKYFRGELGRPSTRVQMHLAQIHHEQKQMQEDLEVVLRAHEEQRLDEEVRRIREKPTLRMDTAPDSLPLRTSVTLPRPTDPSSPPLDTPSIDLTAESPAPDIKLDSEALRILVIGDRLFTDTLLAHRLRLLLPSPTSTPNVLSIHTTSLPQPRDVRPLRWIEDLLSRGKLRDQTDPWAKFAIHLGAHESPAKKPSYFVARWEAIKMDVRDSRMGWDPRQWTVRSVLIGFGKGMVWTVGGVWRVSSNSTRYIWTRSRQFYLDRRKANEVERAERARLENEAEAKILGIETGKRGETRRITARDLDSVEKIEHRELPKITAPPVPRETSTLTPTS